MRTFQSLDDIATELRKKDLERKVLREEIKHEYLALQQGFQHGWLTHPIVRKLSQLGIKYAIQRLIK